MAYTFIHSEMVKVANRIRKEHNDSIPDIIEEAKKIIKYEGRCRADTKCDFCVFDIIFDIGTYMPAHTKVMQSMLIDKEVNLNPHIDDVDFRYRYKKIFFEEFLKELDSNSQLELGF